MRILITGSSGEIGTNLALRLLNDKHEVFGVDRRPNTWTDAFPYMLQDLSNRFVNFKAGIGDQRYPENLDMVVHLAANAKVHELIAEPWRAFDNIAITFNVLEFCRQNNLPIVYASSREVYGDVRRYITEESQTHVSYTESTYSASKISGEALVYAYAKCYAMPYIIFRFSNVYGRYDNDIERMERVIPLFVKKISRDEPIIVYGREKTLDFTYVDDCVQGVVLGIQKLASGAVRNETINLAYGQGHTLLELAGGIADALGKTPSIAVEPSLVGEVTHYVADISKAKKLLGYEPRISLAYGIRLAIANYKNFEADGHASAGEMHGTRQAIRAKRQVLFLSAFFPPYRGGAEVFVEEVGRRLAKTHEVTVLTSRLSRNLPRTETVHGMRIIRIGLGMPLDKYLYPLLSCIKTFFIPHDIVYGVLESYAGIAVALYKVFTRRPAVLNLQSGTLDDWRRGRGFNLFFRRFVHTMPDAIHAISRHLASRATWLGAKHVVVIPNGIDIVRSVAYAKKDQKKIICVGRLYAVKGQDVLLEAMPHVLKEFPGTKLHLIGEGPEKSNLESRIKNLGITGSVIFKGNLPHEKIPSEIAGAAMLVGPSRKEGQGIVFVEAQAAETPVVATAVGGIPEVVEDGITGLLVPPENPQALAQAMLKLLRDPLLAKRLSETAKKQVLRYDWNKIMQEVEALIHETIKHKGMRLLKTIRDTDFSLELPTPTTYTEQESARAVVYDGKNNIALFHAKRKSYHKLPGGGIQENEDVEFALRRELLEEIGCAVQNVRELGMIEEYRNGIGLHHKTYCFIADIVGEKGEPRLEQDEIEEGFEPEWMPLEVAIKTIERETAEVAHYEGKFIRLRDLTFLKEAARIL